MVTNRIIVALLVMTVLLQVGIMYNDHRTKQPRNQSAPTRPEAVQQAPPNTKVDISHLPTQGNPGAGVALIEFSDYECPYCAQHATTVLEQIKADFVAPGKLKYAFANHPLPIHPQALMLATVALCAGKQERYWEMHNVLFRAKPKTRSEAVLLAKGINVDAGELARCLDNNQEIQAQIENETKSAESLGLRGTPAFAVGRITADGLLIKKIILGAQPFATFRETLNDVINGS